MNHAITVGDVALVVTSLLGFAAIVNGSVLAYEGVSHGKRQLTWLGGSITVAGSAIIGCAIVALF